MKGTHGQACGIALVVGNLAGSSGLHAGSDRDKHQTNASLHTKGSAAKPAGIGQSKGGALSRGASGLNPSQRDDMYSMISTLCERAAADGRTLDFKIENGLVDNGHEVAHDGKKWACCKPNGRHKLTIEIGPWPDVIRVPLTQPCPDPHPRRA